MAQVIDSGLAVVAHATRNSRLNSDAVSSWIKSVLGFLGCPQISTKERIKYHKDTYA
jgi:hypothetical protein